MKRSEFPGVKWEPEEPELPKFLRLSMDGANHWRLWPGDSMWRDDVHERNGYRAAVGAYNRLQSGELVPQDKRDEQALRKGTMPADVISKTRGGKTVHYAIGPTRENRYEAERDLREWFDKERS